MTNFEETMHRLQLQHEQLLTRKNMPTDAYNGIFTRYRHPILTAAHTPLFWRYDLDPATNPYCMERIGINAVMNSGAIKFGGKYLLVVRVEGADRKSFFAVAESPNGIDNFRFRDYPVTMPEYGEPATNIYDMRLTAHEDGWIYGSTGFSASNGKTRQRLRATCRPPLQRLASHARKIWWTGSGSPT